VTYACPQGHASNESDYCDECGAKIGGAAPPAAPTRPSPPSPTATAVFSAPATPAATGAICPHCGTPQTGTDRFCEDCGFDHTTGLRPSLAASFPPSVSPAPPVAHAPAGRAWTATVTADRAYFDANGIDGVEFPPYCPARTYSLPAPQVRIGRRSVSKGTDPEMDLSAQPLDPGISHSHALLTLDIAGVWQVSDLGSTNGTYVNDEPSPLAPGRSRALTDGDRVHVGAWTTITVHAPR
jgi:hypothetical protein